MPLNGKKAIGACDTDVYSEHTGFGVLAELSDRRAGLGKDGAGVAEG